MTMKKGPTFMTGETQQTPPPSRFTPLESQSKARVVPASAMSKRTSTSNNLSATPMRTPAQLNQSRLAARKQQSKVEDFRQEGENTPNSVMSAVSAERDDPMGMKKVRVSSFPESRVDSSGQHASSQLLNHSAQIIELQRQVEELKNANRRLVETNDQHAASIKEIANVVMEHKAALQKLEVLGTVLGSLVPAPSSLAYFRDSPESVVVSWETNQAPMLVQNFELSLNGVLCGRVSGKSKKAILSPLDPSQDYLISVQAISQFEDIRSAEASLMVTRIHGGGQSGKQDESMGERMSPR